MTMLLGRVGLVYVLSRPPTTNIAGGGCVRDVCAILYYGACPHICQNGELDLWTRHGRMVAI
jgi:hypothetical protein